jgi:DNA-binding CsgD family transcriptional regulator
MAHHDESRRVNRASSDNPGNSRHTRKRRSRAKRRSEWEEEQILKGAPYAHYIREIAARYPTLTPQEIRVCACIKLMMTSWQIAEKLSITEKSVENLRTKARRKMQLRITDRLHTHLASK